MLAKGTKSVADKLYPAMGNNDSWAPVEVGSDYLIICHGFFVHPNGRFTSFVMFTPIPATMIQFVD